MKNIVKKITKTYSSGQTFYEFYQNHKNEYHGSYIRFFPNGQKDLEGSFLNSRHIGVWKRWYSDVRTWLDTNKNGLNGIIINFE